MSPLASTTVRKARPRRFSTSSAHGRHALMLCLGLLRRRDADQLDLGELMQPDHAARVLARRAGLGTEAGRVSGEAQRQLASSRICFAREIGKRHFGCRNKPESSVDR